MRILSERNINKKTVVLIVVSFIILLSVIYVYNKYFSIFNKVRAEFSEEIKEEMSRLSEYDSDFFVGLGSPLNLDNNGSFQRGLYINNKKTAQLLYDAIKYAEIEDVTGVCWKSSDYNIFLGKRQIGCNNWLIIKGYKDSLYQFKINETYEFQFLNLLEKDLKESAEPNIDKSKDIQDNVYEKVSENKQIQLLMNSPNEIDLFTLYIEGLNSADLGVRLFSCYKMLDYYNSNQEMREIIIQNASKLHNDNDPSIAKAAEFVSSVFSKAYDDERFIISNNSKYIAFTDFYELKYNSGTLYLLDVDNDCLYSYKGVFTNITGLTWSPDDMLLSVSMSGMTWSNVSFINIQDFTHYTPDILAYLVEHQKQLGYSIGKNERPDLNVNLIEWDQEGRRALLSYHITDDNYAGQRGVCEHDIYQKRVIKIIPLGEDEGGNPNPVIKKPEDFNWD